MTSADGQVASLDANRAVLGGRRAAEDRSLTPAPAAVAKSRRTLRTDVLTTTLISLCGRACGFFVPLAIAAAFGSTRATDVLFLVYGVMLSLMLIIGHLFETVIVPHITAAYVKGASIGRLIGAIVTRSTVILVLVLLLMLSAAKPLLAATTRLSPGSLDLALRLFTWMAPVVVLMAWTSALNGSLNACKVFHVGAVSPFFRSATVILFVWLFRAQGVYAVAWGFVLGEVLRFLVTYYCFVRNSGELRPTWTWSAGSIDFFSSAFYQTIGFGLICLIPIVNQMTASWLDPGDMSIHAYALQLRNVPSLLFTAGLGTVVLSYWANDYSRATAEFDFSKVARAMGQLFFIAAICSCSLILLKEWITTLALGWGAFPRASLPLVSRIFAILVASLPFDVAALLCVRILIIFKSDTVYMFLAALKLVLTVALNCLFVPMYGLTGIALAVAVTNALYAAALFSYVSRLRRFTTVSAGGAGTTAAGTPDPCPPLAKESGSW